MIKYQIKRNFGQVGKIFILETLDLYRDDCVTVLEASWQDGVLAAAAKYVDYPFTKEGHIDYLTGSMIPMYVSQVGYLNARFYIVNKLLPKNINIKDRIFMAARDSGDLIFTKLRIKFRKKIHNDGKIINISHKFIRGKVTRNWFFTTFECQFNDSACIVDGMMCMPMNDKAHVIKAVK